MKKLMYLFATMLLLAGCDDRKSNVSDTYEVKIINRSGADFSLIAYNADNEMLERTEILNGREYKWQVKNDALFPISIDKPGRATIGFPFCNLSYSEPTIQDDIDPRWFENYKRIEKDGKVSYQYTFTAEQYKRVKDKYAPRMVNYKCVMVNKSGVKVSFEANVMDERVVFPKTLELLPNGNFEWGFESIKFPPFDPVKTSYPEPIPVPFGNEVPDFSKVLFDDKVEVIYERWDKARDPRFEENYVREVIDNENETFTYTFTEEDYQNALNNVPK